MRFTAAAAVTMAGVAAASWSPDMGSHGHGGYPAAPASNGTMDSYTTEVVTAYTTYCPEATEITHAGQTYTATEATTLTITNCPGGCTVTKPVSSAPPPPMTTPAAPETTSMVEVSSTPVAPVPMSSSTPVAPIPVYPTGGNGTTVAPAPSGTGSMTSATSGAPVPQQSGSGASSLSASAAGILAVFGLVAAAL